MTLERLPDSFIFMKVGNHAGETFEQILERKRRELADSGRIFWGYGGTTLHPISRVQPFSRLTVQQNGTVHLVMEPMESAADPEILPAREMSVDGVHWEPLPDGVHVTGSRYALILNELEPGSLDFPLDDYEVGIGPSSGRAAQDYLLGRVDKGCFVRRSSGALAPQSSRPPRSRSIGFTAELTEPFGVLLR
jgi:hypothetical protein